MMRLTWTLFLALMFAAVDVVSGQTVRALDLGIPFDGEPGTAGRPNVRFALSLAAMAHR